MNVKKIPQSLKNNALWCVWRKDIGMNNKPTKVPYNAISGQYAKSNDPKTFTTFDKALEVCDKYSGLGIGIFYGVCAIDIDHCIDNGTISDMADNIIKTINSYTEISPSGQGIRIIFKAKGYKHDKNIYYINNQKKGLEVYIGGSTSKYVTITGNALNNLEVEERSKEVIKVCNLYMIKPNYTPTIMAPQQNNPVRKAVAQEEAELFLEDIFLESDKVLIDDIWDAAKKQKVSRTTIYRAKDKLGIKSKTMGFAPKQTFWIKYNAQLTLVETAKEVFEID